MYYIQREEGKELETVDETKSIKEAHYLIGEYRLCDSYAYYYISKRACKAWKDRG